MGEIRVTIIRHGESGSERKRDAYDTLNHSNFTLPGRIFGASNFAVTSSALDPREMQLALKLIF